MLSASVRLSLQYVPALVRAVDSRLGFKTSSFFDCSNQNCYVAPVGPVYRNWSVLDIEHSGSKLDQTLSFALQALDAAGGKPARQLQMPNQAVDTHLGSWRQAVEPLSNSISTQLI